MRKELRWTLGGTLLLSAAALWWPQSTPNVVGVIESVSGGDARSAGGLRNEGKPLEPLPESLELLQFEPARRDPFVAAIPAAPVAPPPPKPVRAPPSVAPQPPTAPQLTLRYLGRMVTPDGRPMVLLARGDAAITVQPDMVLDDGYRVLRITSEAVRLVYPATGSEVDIPIPPAPNSP